MLKRAVIFSLLLSSFLFAEEKTFQVFFSGNRQGEIEPCHCQTNQIGGLSRLSTYIEDTKKTFKGETFFVDSGDIFFAQPAFPEVLKERESSKASLIAETYKFLGIDFLIFGERDFAAGAPELSVLLKKTGAMYPLPDASSWTQVLEKGKVRIGILALLKEGAIEASIKKLKAQNVDQTLVVSHLGFEEDKKIAGSFENILIVGSHSLRGSDKPLIIGKSAIVETQEGGKNIGRVIFTSSNVSEAQFEFTDLDKKYDRKNAVSDKVRKFIQEEKKKTIAAEKNKTTPSKSSAAYVANPFVCKQCHAKQFEFWKNTKHSSAYLVLYAKNQHFDRDCVSCHVLGFENKEGFSKISEPIDASKESNSVEPFVEVFLKEVFQNQVSPIDSRLDPKRYALLHQQYLSLLEKLHTEKKLKKVFMGVQCEHCHGNRNSHLQTGLRGAKPSVPTTCLSCHRAPNAPAFKKSMIPLASCPKS